MQNLPGVKQRGGKSKMAAALGFEIFVLLLTAAVLFYMKKTGRKRVFQKFLILVLDVLLFEFMSEPMWLNRGFGAWAYLYRDITWVLTIGWASLFLIAIMVVDVIVPTLAESKRFWLYLLVLEVLVVPIEMFLLSTEIRSYAPVLIQTMSGLFIPFTSIPVEMILAVPLFATLVLTFYKYGCFLLEGK